MAKTPKGKGKSAAKRINRRIKQDVYSIYNVVLTSSMSSKIPMQSIQALDANCPRESNKILIPQFRVITEGDYNIDPQLDIDVDPQEDLDQHYIALHKPYEMAEICNKYLDNGHDLPPAWRNGLKVRIRLPPTFGELPTLLD